MFMGSLQRELRPLHLCMVLVLFLSFVLSNSSLFVFILSYVISLLLFF